MLKANEEGLMEKEVWQCQEEEIKDTEEEKALMRKRGFTAQNLFEKQPCVEPPVWSQQGTFEPQPTIVKLPPPVTKMPPPQPSGNLTLSMSTMDEMEGFHESDEEDP